MIVVDNTLAVYDHCNNIHVILCIILLCYVFDTVICECSHGVAVLCTVCVTRTKRETNQNDLVKCSLKVNHPIGLFIFSN